jgi:peptidoglycan/xylan/chitin deacetylase (PgdA/CDA1 family)
VNKIATAISFLGLIAVAGCSGTQDTNKVNAGSADSAIFQQGMSSVSGANVGLIGTKTLALTFDDGPQKGSTENLLDYLKSEDIRATFFMVGRNIIGNDTLLDRMSDEGMSLGNHTFDHTPIVKMSKTNMNGVYKEIAQDDALISPHLIQGKHIFFRSPGGSWTHLIADAMNQHPDIAQKYIGPVFWDIGGTTMFADSQGRRISGEAVKYDPSTATVSLVRRNQKGAIINRWTEQSTSLYAAADWDCSISSLNISVRMCADGYMKEIERLNGGVVLLHDTHPKTIEMVKLLIPRLKAAGYNFITLDEIPNIQKFE